MRTPLVEWQRARRGSRYAWRSVVMSGPWGMCWQGVVAVCDAGYFVATIPVQLKCKGCKECSWS